MKLNHPQSVFPASDRLILEPAGLKEPAGSFFDPENIAAVLESEHARAKRGAKFKMSCHAEGCTEPASDPLPFCYPHWVRIPVHLKMDFYLDSHGDYVFALAARDGWVGFMQDCIAALELKRLGL